MNFFEDFVCVLQMILLTKIKISMLVLGLHSKDRTSTKDKANIRNPKVNRGWPPLTANCTSADCMQISLGPPIQYISLRVYRTRVFNAMLAAPWPWNLMDDGKMGPFSLLLQHVCVMSWPPENSNSRYPPEPLKLVPNRRFFSPQGHVFNVEIYTFLCPNNQCEGYSTIFASFDIHVLCCLELPKTLATLWTGRPYLTGITVGWCRWYLSNENVVQNI